MPHGTSQCHFHRCKRNNLEMTQIAYFLIQHGIIELDCPTVNVSRMKSDLVEMTITK